MRVLICFLAAAVWCAAAEYTAKWSSNNSDARGDIRIRLEPDPEVTFTLGAQEVKTKIASLKKTAGGFEIAYDFSLDGYDLRSTLKSKVSGTRLEGEYRTTPSGGGDMVDSGTFRGELKQ